MCQSTRRHFCCRRSCASGSKTSNRWSPSRSWRRGSSRSGAILWPHRWTGWALVLACRAAARWGRRSSRPRRSGSLRGPTLGCEPHSQRLALCRRRRSSCTSSSPCSNSRRKPPKDRKDSLTTCSHTRWRSRRAPARHPRASAPAPNHPHPLTVVRARAPGGAGGGRTAPFIAAAACAAAHRRPTGNVPVDVARGSTASRIEPAGWAVRASANAPAAVSCRAARKCVLKSDMCAALTLGPFDSRLPGSTSWLLPMDAIVQAASVAIQPPSHSSPSPHCAPPAALPMPEAGAGSGGPGNNIDAWIAAINSVQARQSSDASEAQELGSHAAQALHVGEKRPRELAPHELDLVQQGLPPQGLAPQGAAQQQALHQVALPPQQAPPQQHSDAAGQQAPLASAAEALSLLTGGGWAES